MADEMSDELRDEYDFDYTQAKPNQFAPMFGSLKSGGRVVYLDPEVAERFKTSEEVNRLLKALLETMPAPTTKVAESPKV